MWICCQLGAREHYSFSRALQRTGALDRLLTDTWVPPDSMAARIPIQRWTDRSGGGLDRGAVTSWNLSSAWFELRNRVAKNNGWPLILKRNTWFQSKLFHYLATHVPNSTPDGKVVLFSYSYTAERPFALARKRNWLTVLGQIDPGPAEERIVARLHAEAGDQSNGWQPAPQEYWRSWRREISAAGRVIVNSEWSRQALVEEGVATSKIDVIPLVYEPSAESMGFVRQYPARFSAERPLRVLFLGQVSLRKGIGPLLEVARRMAHAPVEFWIVGPLSFPVRTDTPAKVRWIGPVPRSAASGYYRAADVFVLPTFSDGFGLTQLEAQAWKLPVIASRCCGEVVRDGQNGILLQEVTAQCLEEAVNRCRRPLELAAMSQRSGVGSPFTLSDLGRRLLEIAGCS